MRICAPEYHHRTHQLDSLCGEATAFAGSLLGHGPDVTDRTPSAVHADSTPPGTAGPAASNLHVKSTIHAAYVKWGFSIRLSLGRR